LVGKKCGAGFSLRGTSVPLLVLDTATGKVIASIPTVGDCDDVFYDQTRKRIYATGGEGAISVIQQQDADHYKEFAKIATVSGARTGLFSPELDRLFVPKLCINCSTRAKSWLAQSLVQRRHILKELVQAGRSHHDQYVCCFVPEVLESVRGAAWSERRTPRAPGEALPVHLPGEISVEHVEPLILPRVAVQGGPASLGTPLPGHPCLYIP